MKLGLKEKKKFMDDKKKIHNKTKLRGKI